MWKLKFRLYLFTLVSTLPFILYIGYTHNLSIQREQEQELNHLSEVASHTAAEHRQITEGARQLLISLANNPTVLAGQTEECNEFLLTLKSSYVRYVNFGVIDKNGNVLCAADIVQTKENPPYKELVEKTLNSQSFTVGSYYPIKPQGAVINMAYPLSQDRVIYASLSLEWVSDFVKDLDISSTGFVTNILDNNGTVLARDPKTDDAVGKNFVSNPLVQEILKNGEGQTTKVGIDNVLRLYAFRSLDDAHSAYVAVGIPQSSIYDSINRSILTSVLIILGIIVFSFAFAQKIGQILILKQVESLQKLDKLKEEFVSLASHQLRSPMTAIRWLAESLLESKSNISKTQRAAIKKIHLTSLRLINLTSFLLNISRLEAGSLTPHPKHISVTESVQPILNELRPIAKNEQIKIVAKIPSKLSLYTDPTLVGEILRVLISNSIQYSKEKSSITLTVSPDRDNTSFHIIDHGIGIPDKMQSNIFTRFYRADNARSHKPDGNGLGLYLAQLIATKLQGTLTFTSIPEKTTFTLTLPNEVT